MVEWLRTMLCANGTDAKESLDIKRSKVRIHVTKFAAFFLFGGGLAFIGYCLYMGQDDRAQELFLTILPVATGIVSYWFAARSQPQSPKKGKDD